METAKDRLVRYLKDAWAVEKSMVEHCDKAADGALDADSQLAFSEFREATHIREEALEARIRSFGEEPSGGVGMVSKLLANIAQWVHVPKDEVDGAAQQLMQMYGLEHFRIAMYESLRAYSDAIGDRETASLAQSSLTDCRAAAERVWRLIEPAAIRAAGAAEGSTFRHAA